MSDRLLRDLYHFFRFEGFRSGQEEVVEAVEAGRDCLGVLPTGAGKSLCYQLPALRRKHGWALVVSPLIALMRDQVANLHARGLRQADAIYSGMGSQQVGETLNAVRGGTLKLLYVSPERLCTPNFQQFLKINPPWLAVADEAHCVSQWGHDFRREYMGLGEALTHIPGVRKLALTATATDRVKKEIVSSLQMKNQTVVIGDFDRPNLELIADVTTDQNRPAQVAQALRALGGRSIVYVMRRRDAESMAWFLQRKGIRADAYHAGLGPAQRDLVQAQFIDGRTHVICATIAFGLGIDIPDIRSVIHATLPGAPETYYQEIGRAGRDGATSRCMMLWTKQDSGRRKWMISRNYPYERAVRQIWQDIKALPGHVEIDQEAIQKQYPKENIEICLQRLEEVGVLEQQRGRWFLREERPEKLPALDFSLHRERMDGDYERLGQMIHFAETTKCRRNALLPYFEGSHYQPKENCGMCDGCVAELKQNAFKALPASKRKASVAGATLEHGPIKPEEVRQHLENGKVHRPLGLAILHLVRENEKTLTVEDVATVLIGGFRESLSARVPSRLAGTASGCQISELCEAVRLMLRKEFLEELGEGLILTPQGTQALQKAGLAPRRKAASAPRSRSRAT